jgi:hypothetical protein
MSEDISALEEGQMENLVTNADYHESCRLLYSTIPAEPELFADENPMLIRAEYPRIFDQLTSLNDQACKAVVTGQPGIGNSPCAVSYMVNMANWDFCIMSCGDSCATECQ